MGQINQLEELLAVIRRMITVNKKLLCDDELDDKRKLKLRDDLEILELEEEKILDQLDIE